MSTVHNNVYMFMVMCVNKVIKSYFTDNNLRRMWQRKQHSTNNKGNNHGVVGADAPLAEKFNCFFVQLEAERLLKSSSLPLASTSDTVNVKEYGVRRSLSSVNLRKAAGPDREPGKILKRRRGG